jgi:hypothetical protein
MMPARQSAGSLSCGNHRADGGFMKPVGAKKVALPADQENPVPQAGRPGTPPSRRPATKTRSQCCNHSCVRTTDTPEKVEEQCRGSNAARPASTPSKLETRSRPWLTPITAMAATRRRRRSPTPIPVFPLLACRSARSSRSTPSPTGRDRRNVTVASRFTVIPSGYHDSLRACASSPEPSDVAASGVRTAGSSPHDSQADPIRREATGVDAAVICQISPAGRGVSSTA